MNLEQNVKERLALYECLPYGLETVLHTAGELFHNPIILTTAGYKVISLINTTGVENPIQFGNFVPNMDIAALILSTILKVPASLRQSIPPLALHGSISV